MKKLLIAILLSFSFVASAQQLNIALLKYRGGGDWYGNPTSLPNLVRFCNQEIGTDINPNVPTVEPSSPDLFNYPYVYMTGHGNVVRPRHRTCAITCWRAVSCISTTTTVSDSTSNLR